MKYLKYSLLCLALCSAFLLQAQERKNVRVFIYPAITEVKEGASFDVEIVADFSETYELMGSFTGVLTWNAKLLAYQGNGGLESDFKGRINEKAVKAGQLSFDGVNVKGRNGYVSLLKVSFEAGKASTANLDLELSTLGSAFSFYNLLPGATISDARVEIKAADDIQLLRFNANPKDNYAAIAWAVTNQAGTIFKLYHSTDGIQFGLIHTQKSKPSFERISTYDYLDKEARKGLNYYRLSILYPNGTTENSHIINCFIGRQRTPSSSIYPNPAGHYFTLNLGEEMNGTARLLEIVDQYGRVLKQLPITKSNMVVDIKDLSAGLYTVQISNGRNTVVHKMTKL